MTPLKYLQHYPLHLQNQILQLQAQNKLGDYIAVRYPNSHTIQTDKALYTYCNDIRQTYMRNSPQLDKVHYDSHLGIEHHALGLNTAISRVQGGKLKAKKEIKISAFFKEAPAEFLRMIVVHELAHLKERNHDKAFYQLCQFMEPDYHQFEFDCRVYLTWKNQANSS
ncbi:MAG TPA: M48 family metallopeptidase [Methylotenera sp.]|nr:M48 family metallopeptidase [Methylotenera sp.]HPH04922.1 M48 family metallopeptidase [Methylotenera sp.]HPN01754.1 M48 family metallopeptidase [Methylotenera sp.]